MAGVELAPHIVRRAPPVFLSLFFSVAYEVDAHREHACDSADPQQSYVFQQIHGWSPTIWCSGVIHQPCVRSMATAVSISSVSNPTLPKVNSVSVNYDATTKNNRMQQALNAIDGGTGNGVLVIGTAALSGATGVLATITLQKPSFSLSGGVLTLLGVPLSATASAGGTAAKAELRDSSGAVKVSGLTVGTSSADVIINSVTISASQTVQVVSPSTLTHN